MFIWAGVIVPTGKPAQLTSESRIISSHFWGVQSNYDATGNVFILFVYPSMNSNRNNLKIQIKIFEPKIEKSYTPCFFLKMAKIFSLNIQVILIENH